MKPGHYIGGGQRLTDDDMDRINADIKEEPPGRLAGWTYVVLFAGCCWFWYWLWTLLVKART